ncbi:MAG: TolC family protein [Salinicola sp.]|uniref:TolC family protein n=1 Tax=Salinicola sp. TaxID=1978524 RepID=UPI001DE7F55C|nr:TolC family protein [Salinicola sp.]NRB58134.1 TolC family protein [Salinicola sp.]
MFLHRFYALPGWLIVGWLGMAGGAHASPLSFDDALALGVRNAPELSANTAQIKSAQELIEPADALPDPKLSLGVTNYPISGPQAGSLTESQMTMQRIGISQAIPNSAKRHARAEIAEAELSSAQVQRHVVRLIIQQQASQAWLKRYYLERKLEQLDALDRENQLLTSTVDARIASGDAPLTDSVLAKQAAAALADRRDDLEGERHEAIAELRRYVGEAADEPLEGAPPSIVVSPQTLRARIRRYPDLLALEAQTRTAKARVAEAKSEKRPDWGVELAYQHRDERYGDMVSAQVSFDLPLFTASRQDPAIRARQHNVERLQLERDALLREQRSELDSQLADYTALSNQLKRAQTTWLKLVQKKVGLQYAAYRSGQGDLDAVIAARRELIDQRVRIVDLQQQRKLIAMKLYFSYGEPTS